MQTKNYSWQQNFVDVAYWKEGWKKRLSSIIVICIMSITMMLLCGVTDIRAATSTVDAPVVSSETVTKPTLVWDSLGEKYFYRVYRSETKNGEYICLEKELHTTKYTDVSAVAGCKYYYKVRAIWVNKKGNIIYGKLSKPLYIEWVKDDLILTLNVKGEESYLSWTSLNGNKYKYSIWKSANVNGKYVCIKKNITTNSYKLNTSAKSNICYYKVRPYKEINGKQIYGALSNICLNKRTVDVVIFMGQSNMAGRGENLKKAPTLEINTGYEFRAITDPTKLYHLAEPFGKFENVDGQ